VLFVLNLIGLATFDEMADRMDMIFIMCMYHLSGSLMLLYQNFSTVLTTVKNIDMFCLAPPPLPTTVASPGYVMCALTSALLLFMNAYLSLKHFQY